MQSTGQARAHLSQPMQVVRSKRWKPRYLGRIGTGRSGYSKCSRNVFFRYDCTKYQRVTYMPRARVEVARPMFRNQVRMFGEEVRVQRSAVSDARGLYRAAGRIQSECNAGAPDQTHRAQF